MIRPYKAEDFDASELVEAIVDACNRAYTDGYEKGRADQKKEDNEFFNFEGAWELEKERIRVEAIEECIKTITNLCGGLPNINIIGALEQLKEQNK